MVELDWLGVIFNIFALVSFNTPKKNGLQDPIEIHEAIPQSGSMKKPLGKALAWLWQPYIVTFQVASRIYDGYQAPKEVCHPIQDNNM